jgi:hypothetical protein
MATCPVIKYGIPSEGAPEYNVNSGREIFRCADCVRLYITNVSLEKSIVRYSCGDIMDANTGQGACLQSANASARDRNVINWIAKDNVDTSLPNGYVITRVGDCEGNSGIVYTHTEGSISVRAYANIEDIDVSTAEAIVSKAKEKLANYLDDVNKLDYFLSDLNVNASPTDWQSTSITFQGIGSEKIDDSGTGTFRVNFNWNNGRVQISKGSSTYDTSPEPKLLSEIIASLLA